MAYVLLLAEFDQRNKLVREFKKSYQRSLRRDLMSKNRKNNLSVEKN